MPWPGEVRQAEGGDADDVARLAAALAMSFEFSAARFRENYPALLAADGACLLLAVSGQQSVGYLLGFLLLFAVLTPAAIITAVGALKEIRVQPALRGRWKAWTGIGLAVVAPVLWVSAFLAFAENGTFGIF